MAAEPPVALCPTCGKLVPVPEEWRMVECPACHAVIVRMDSDARYD
ncbi:MAG TPA: hypothetical protein VMG81_07675 [Thermoplasmata archaeon]|nr:hypothetical protein [Thermoplasmata archaeon]